MSLGKYDGRAIVGVELKVTKTGDGLSDAMRVEPVTLHHGEYVYLVVRAQVVDAQHPFADKKTRDAVRRKYVCEATDVAIVDEAEVGELLVKAHDRIQRGLDSIKGQGRFDDGEEDI